MSNDYESDLANEIQQILGLNYTIDRSQVRNEIFKCLMCGSGYSDNEDPIQMKRELPFIEEILDADEEAKELFEA